jgi:hypothetical protein
MCSAASSGNVCIAVFSSGGSSSYAMIRTEQNVATRQTTRVARDMIRPMTRQDKTVAHRRQDVRPVGSTELDTWSASFTHFRCRDTIWVLNHISTMSILRMRITDDCYTDGVNVACGRHFVLPRQFPSAKLPSGMKFLATGSVVVKALCYKPEGRGLETR